MPHARIEGGVSLLARPHQPRQQGQDEHSGDDEDGSPTHGSLKALRHQLCVKVPRSGDKQAHAGYLAQVAREAFRDLLAQRARVAPDGQSRRGDLAGFHGGG